MIMIYISISSPRIFHSRYTLIKYKSSIPFIDCLQSLRLFFRIPYELNHKNPVELFAYDAIICLYYACICAIEIHVTTINVIHTTDVYTNKYSEVCVRTRAPVLYSLWVLYTAHPKIIARDNMWNRTKHTSQCMNRMGLVFQYSFSRRTRYVLTVPFKINIFILFFTISCIKSSIYSLVFIRISRL